MKLYDTFMIGSCPQDLDMLECRLYELGDNDPFHAHVIVEGDTTFTGTPKPFYYAEHRERFARWNDKIRYVRIHPGTDIPGDSPGEAWAREASSRQECWQGLDDAENNDLIIHGDVDEILRNEAIAELASFEGSGMAGMPVKLNLRHYSFAVDWEQPWVWHAPTVARFSQVNSFSDLRYTGWASYALSGGLSDRLDGWHLSWVGGPEAHRIKARSYAHTEAAQMVLEAVESGKFYEQGLWHGNDPSGKFYDWEPMIAADVDETWPRYVCERKCPANWFRPR